MEGSVYQFAHLSFHEFFSGRGLARCLFHGLESETKSAISFISKNKYKEVHWETLSFMTQRAIDVKGEEAIEQILSVIDQEPRDILGVQHTFLKLRIFDAYLSMANTTENMNYPPCCDDVIKTSSKLIVESWKSEERIELLIRHVEQLPNVMENLPKPMFDAFVEGWSIDYSNSRKVKALERLATFARICPSLVETFKQAFWNQEAAKSSFFYGVHRYCLEKFVKPLSEVPEFVINYLNDWCHSGSTDGVRVALNYVCGILKKRPRNANHVWKMLIDRCLDYDFQIRFRALSNIQIVDEAGVDVAKHVWEQMTQSIVKNDGHTTLLEEAYKHEDADTRLRAIKLRLECCIALRHSPKIIEAAFLMGMSDSNWIVRCDVIPYLKKLAHLGNAYASIVEKVLKMGFEDNESQCRKRAIEHAIDICNVLNNRDLAVELLVNRCLYESVSYVRRIAVESVVKLVTKEEDSEILMDALESCCSDEFSYVRSEVCRHIVDVVVRVPSLAPDVLKMLKSRCSDEDSYVRSEVFRHIVDVVVRVPSLAPDVLKMLKSRWNDEDESVRYQVVDSLCDLCLNMNPVDELSDVLSTESVDTNGVINEKITILKEHLKFFGDETDVEFFRFLLRRYMSDGDSYRGLLKDKIMRMALVIEQSDLLMLDAVREVVCELVHSGQALDANITFNSWNDDDKWMRRMYGTMSRTAKLFKHLVRSIQDSSKTPAYASELMTHVLYLHNEKDEDEDSDVCEKIIDTVPFDYILEYLLSKRDGSLDDAFKKRFLGIAVTVVDSCDNQSKGLSIYESSEETFVRKSPQDIDYLVQLLKSIYSTL